MWCKTSGRGQQGYIRYLVHDYVMMNPAGLNYEFGVVNSCKLQGTGKNKENILPVLCMNIELTIVNNELINCQLQEYDSVQSS